MISKVLVMDESSTLNKAFYVNAVTYSFVIPARNEEKDIQRCINSIKSISGIKNYEIIVVDNGSIDNTAKVARNEGVIVLYKTDCFVGAVRNAGVKKAKGEILCFIDADCTISPGWFAQVEAYTDELKSGKIGVVGAEHLLPPDSNLIQKAWFSHQRCNLVGSAQMVPSGNMVISKSLFQSFGGFSEAITSGEDFELCDRCRRKGFSVVHDYRLECFHYGNPATLRRFFKRERWHGRGMIADLKDPLQSRPLMISFVYVFSYLAGALILFLSFINVQALRFEFFLLIPFIFPPLVFSFLRSYKSSRIKYFPVLFVLYLVYGTARSISLVEILMHLVQRVAFPRTKNHEA
jgi:glycosyltransferase involved in cell wall biosynthesis